MASELGVQTIQHTNGTDALTIGSDGATAIDRIQIPSFHVTALNVDQSYTASSDTVVQFNSVDLDTESGWDAVNHRYVPSIAGWYMLASGVRCQAGGTAPFYVGVDLVKNGSNPSTVSVSENIRTQIQLASGSLSNSMVPGPSGMMYFNGTTDYVNVVFRANQNVTLSDADNIISWFSGHLVKAGA